MKNVLLKYEKFKLTIKMNHAKYVEKHVHNNYGEYICLHFNNFVIISKTTMTREHTYVPYIACAFLFSDTYTKALVCELHIPLFLGTVGFFKKAYLIMHLYRII